jgi:hypothetical protein
MLRFYMDQHVHGGITAGLRRIGIGCLTAAEDGSNELGDASLLARATELERVVFSNDLDMPLLAEQWMLQLRTFAGVIYARQLGITIGQAVRELEPIAHSLAPEQLRNSA